MRDPLLASSRPYCTDGSAYETVLKDTQLKTTVREILENCRLDDLIVDREVQFSFTGETDNKGNFLTEKEIDVVARFSYRGKKILCLFECSDSNAAARVRKRYREYKADVSAFSDARDRIRVIRSTDTRLQGRHFKDIDLVRTCFVYGASLPDKSYQICVREAKRHSFLVWNHRALTYYQKISSVLGKLTRYELFKDFNLGLEGSSTIAIRAIRMKQKNKTMYLGAIHPGLLLRIGYVVRRASERTDAYQRMLNKQRIAAIGEFISSSDPQCFLPNAVIVVVDRSIRSLVHFHEDRQELTLPLSYCSAWMIDGQHRAYGFLGTRYEDWTEDRYKPFDLPIIVFLDLPEPLQTQTFININYFQNRIKSNLLCDLTTLTKDLRHKLTWPSLIGRELNELKDSPFKDKVKVSELDYGRSISLSSLAQYGLLETLLGFRARETLTYSGPLFSYAPFNHTKRFDSPTNQAAFHAQVALLVRFLDAVRRNTAKSDARTDPWRNTRAYSLLRPTGVNALLMVLARILKKHADAGLNLETFLRPLRSVSFKRDYVARKGGGWKGFRGLANVMITRLNKTANPGDRLALYGTKEKM
jgi:DGQHR domain-containing protein